MSLLFAINFSQSKAVKPILGLERVQKAELEAIIIEELMLHFSSSKEVSPKGLQLKAENGDPLRLWTVEMEKLTQVKKLIDIQPAYAQLVKSLN